MLGKPQTVAVLDIGSSKICCLIAKIEPTGKISIQGIGYHMSRGIKAGIISDIEQAKSSIISAVQAAEKKAGINIEKVVVGIAPRDLVIKKLHVKTNIYAETVSEKDIQKTIQKGFEVFENTAIVPLHSIPIDYNLDGVENIDNPKDMLGNDLTARLHVIGVNSKIINNISACLTNCKLEIQTFILNPYASALACITDDIKDYNLMVLDIGAHLTDIAVFINGALDHVDTVTLGAENILKDVSVVLAINPKKAQKILNMHGGVGLTNSYEDEFIDITEEQAGRKFHKNNLNVILDSEGVSQVTQLHLNEIIHARVSEIFEQVKAKLGKHTNNLANFKLILTGGASELTDIKHLAKETFGTNSVVTGVLKEKINNEYNAESLSSSIGMLTYLASEHNADNYLLTKRVKMNKSNNKSGFLNRIVDLFRG